MIRKGHYSGLKLKSQKDCLKKLPINDFVFAVSLVGFKIIHKFHELIARVFDKFEAGNYCSQTTFSSFSKINILLDSSLPKSWTIGLKL